MTPGRGDWLLLLAPLGLLVAVTLIAGGLALSFLWR